MHSNLCYFNFNFFSASTHNDNDRSDATTAALADDGIYDNAVYEFQVTSLSLEALTVSFDDPHTDSLVTGACYVTLSSIFA